jgi:uncharacterized protein YkwD
MLSSLKNKPLWALAVLAAVLAFPAAGGAAGRTASENSLLKEINRVRAAHGLRALRYDARLARAARAHTRDMARGGYFAHGDFAPRMVRFHIRGPFVGENLAWGTGPYGTARGVVEAWLRSPPHRRNLLRPGFRRIGLGELTASFEGVGGANVVTADFAGY